MSYIVTTCREKGSKPLVVSTPDMDEAGAREFARNLAANGMNRVTLHRLTEMGIIHPVSVWTTGGKRARRITEEVEQPKVQRVAEAEEPAPRRRTRAKAKEEQPEPEPEPEPETAEDVSIETDEDDEAHTYDGFCVKCREARTFHGEVVPTANGQYRAKGTCPVCGTGMSRMLGKHPEPEWHDEETTPSTEGDDNPDAGLDEEETEENRDDNPDVPDLDETDEDEAPEVEAETITEAIAEAVPAGAKIESVTEAVAEAAEEVAEAAKETKKRRPRKRTSTIVKVKKDVPDTVKEYQDVRTCPKCGRKQPVMDRAGLTIFMSHSAPGLDRCPGSTTVVS